MTAFFWALFIDANSYEENINNISSSDAKPKVSADIYFSKKNSFSLKKIRKGYAKELSLVGHKIQRNRIKENVSKSFLFRIINAPSYVTDKTGIIEN